MFNDNEKENLFGSSLPDNQNDTTQNHETIINSNIGQNPILEKNEQSNEIQNGIKDSNDLFFEKFNNTKKNYKKEQLKNVKKQLDKKNKSLSFERRLENNRYLTKIYIILGVIIFFTLALSITVFVININFIDSSGSKYANNSTWYGIDFIGHILYPTLFKATVVIAGVSFGLIPLPFIFLGITWFIGLNQVFRSRIFIYTLFVVIGISAILALSLVPMIGLLYDNHGFLAIGSYE